MYAQRSSAGRVREHVDYATLRQNQVMRDCGCRADAPVANVTPPTPSTPTCLESYPLAMVYAPTQPFADLYCDSTNTLLEFPSILNVQLPPRQSAIWKSS